MDQVNEARRIDFDKAKSGKLRLKDFTREEIMARYRSEAQGSAWDSKVIVV